MTTYHWFHLLPFFPDFKGPCDDIQCSQFITYPQQYIVTLTPYENAPFAICKVASLWMWYHTTKSQETRSSAPYATYTTHIKHINVCYTHVTCIVHAYYTVITLMLHPYYIVYSVHKALGITPHYKSDRQNSPSHTEHALWLHNFIHMHFIIVI